MTTRVKALLAATVALASIAAGPVGGAGAARVGSIEGRVVNAATGRPQKGVVVTLSSAGPEKAREIARSKTGRDGRYRFDDLPTGAGFYALDARFDGGIFAGSPVSLPDDTKRSPVIESTLRVWPTTTDASVISVDRNDLFLLQGEDGLGVIESVTFTNNSTRAYIGRRGGQSLGFSLPRGAGAGGVTILDSDLDVPVLAPADFGFATTIAVPPGERQLTFTYSVRGTAGTYDVSRTVLYPTSRFTVFAAEPLEVGSNRLEERGTRVIDSKTYSVHGADGSIAAGDAVQITAVAEGGGDPALRNGAIAIGILLLGSAAFMLTRTRRNRPRERNRPGERDRLLRDAAELDIRHARGELSDDEYRTQRDAITRRITGPHEHEGAP